MELCIIETTHKTNGSLTNLIKEIIEMVEQVDAVRASSHDRIETTPNYRTNVIENRLRSS